LLLALLQVDSIEVVMLKLLMSSQPTKVDIQRLR
jgi:hypothetical protein